MKYYERMIRQAEEKGKRRFERQFQDALQSLEAQLNVGYSMENAIKEVQRDLQIIYDRHTLIVREFTYMVRQLNLNVTAEAAWKDFAARVALPEVDTFVTVFSLAKRSGGDSILIIKNAVRQLGDKAEVKREIDTVIAAKKMEFQIMSVIPLGIIGYMRLSFPEFMAGLYGNLPGAAFMSICLGALTGKIIGTPEHEKQNGDHDYTNVFDGKTWTSFDYSKPTGGWAGLDLGKEVKVDRIVYTPRNRDNYVRPGDVYELFYCERDWQSAGTIKATADSLVFRNIPENALLLLRNHTRGKDERIFVYENGEQQWR